MESSDNHSWCAFQMEAFSVRALLEFCGKIDDQTMNIILSVENVHADNATLRGLSARRDSGRQ